MTDEGERLDFLVRQLEGGSLTKFSQKTGIVMSSLCRIKTGRLRIRGKVNTILRAYPMVERKWLETGEGYCGDLSVEIVNEKMERALAEKDIIIKALTEQLMLNQEILKKLTK